MNSFYKWMVELSDESYSSCIEEWLLIDTNAEVDDCNGKLLVDGNKIGFIEIIDVDIPDVDMSYFCATPVTTEDGVNTFFSFLFEDINEFPPLPTDISLYQVIDVKEGVSREPTLDWPPLNFM